MSEQLSTGRKTDKRPHIKQLIEYELFKYTLGHSDLHVHIIMDNLKLIQKGFFKQKNI